MSNSLWSAIILASSRSTNACRPTGGAQDGDSLVLRSVLVTAPPNSGARVHGNCWFFENVAPVWDNTTTIPDVCPFRGAR